ncbi:MAG: LysM peptidoglycan-binding domain-containing protein [Opitutaceae bacterium]
MKRSPLILRLLAGVFVCGLLTAVFAEAARTHVVQRGETLSSIAVKYGVTVAELSRANRLRDADMLRRGQKLVVPGSEGASWTGSHTVSPGETLSSIAALYRVPVDDLTAANNLRNADFVRRGQVLLVPAVEGATSPRPADPGAPAQVHTVQRRDTLSSIAAAYGVTVRDLARANKLRDADLLHPGQKLDIPAGAPAFIEHSVSRGESLASIASRYKVALADIRAANTLRDPDFISPGQVLRIPASDTALPENEPARRSSSSARATSDPRHRLPAAIRAAIDSAKVERRRWKNIVVHHSGTSVGSGKGMDRYHREERRMENGLAYHFVIGNGRGMTDGSIFVGRRWNEQLDGGHVVSPELNHISIGICLVGDFQKRPPSRRQMESLEALVGALMKRADLDYTAFTTHRLIHPRHTLCPGKHFPTEHFRQLLRAN